jgi:hypothetical protein
MFFKSPYAFQEGIGLWLRIFKIAMMADGLRKLGTEFKIFSFSRSSPLPDNVRRVKGIMRCIQFNGVKKLSDKAERNREAGVFGGYNFPAQLAAPQVAAPTYTFGVARRPGNTAAFCNGSGGRRKSKDPNV